MGSPVGVPVGVAVRIEGIDDGNDVGAPDGREVEGKDVVDDVRNCTNPPDVTTSETRCCKVDEMNTPD